MSEKNRKSSKNEKKEKMPKDAVETASQDSFPASDPPSWTGTTAKASTSNEDLKEKK